MKASRMKATLQADFRYSTQLLLPCLKTIIARPLVFDLSPGLLAMTFGLPSEILDLRSSYFG